MRVLHLLDELNPGGLEMMLLDISKKSKENGLDMIVVSMKGGALENEFKNTDIIYIKLLRKYPFDLSIIFQLRKIIKNNEINIIHSHLIIAAIHAYFASLGMNTKNILSHHGISPYFRKKDIFLEKFIIPRMDYNIAVSKSFLDKLRIEKNNNIHKNFGVIYNGLDTKKFDNGNKRFREEKGFNDSDILMGMVGNFINNKDQITICKALPEVFKKFNNTKFFFIGNKSEKYPKEYEDCYDFCFKNNLMDRVFFFEKVTNVANILHSLDIFIFSSLNESFGIAPVEAMICGIPIIAADIPVMKEISNNGEFVIMYKAGDSHDLEEKIINTIIQLNDVKKLTAQIKKWATENFSIENHIRNLILLYKKII